MLSRSLPRRHRRVLGLVSALAVSLVLTVPAAAAGGPVSAGAIGPASASPASYPLHTSGRWIENSSGQRVKLASTNWDGFESKEFVVGGLEHQTLDSIATWIADNGFNSVRLPWSNEMYEHNPVVDAKYLTANPGLQGMRSLDILDTVIDTLGRHGLMVILDNHQTDAGWCCNTTDGNGLWYTGSLAGFSEAQWEQDWAGMAARYAGNHTVVGAELRNEIRSANGVTPTWGDNSAHDWRRAAKAAGNTILGANPNLLVFVGGLSYSVRFDQDKFASTDAASFFTVPNRLVWAPHFYKWDFNGNQSAWTGWNSINGFTNDGPAAAEFAPAGSNPQMVVFSRGTDGQVYENSWSSPKGPWTGWHSIGGDITGSPAVAVFGQQVEVFGRGTNGAVWGNVWTLSTGTWSGWFSLGGNITGSPSATAFYPPGQDPQVQVYGRGTDGLIYENIGTQSGGFTGFFGLAGSDATVGSPSATAFGPNQVQLYARDSGGAVRTSTWTEPGTNGWSDWSSIGGDVTSSPAATPSGGCQMQVFARGTNGHAYQNVWQGDCSHGQWTGTGAWRGWADIGGNIVGAPAAAQFGYQMQVFAEGTDTQVYTDVWGPNDYTAFHSEVGSDWGWLLTQGKSYTAPIWVSEWGTCITEVAQCTAVDAGFFDNMTEYLREGDIDFAYWQLGSQQLECGCPSRHYGALDYYGLLNPNWNGPANATNVNRVKALQSPTQFP